MKNEIQEPGVCAYCGEESDRLFEPPLLEPDNWRDVSCSMTDGAKWIVPGSAYPGPELFNTVARNETASYLRPYESPDEPVCWECFDGLLPPSMRPYCVNLPAQIKFNGYKKPEWVDV